MLNLLLLLFLSLMAFAVGFARQEERTVTVPLKSSVRLRGVSYHPNSQGVEMPVSHAKALGFTEDQYLGEPEEEDDSSESKSDGEPETEDTGASESEDTDGEAAEESEEDASKEEAEPESDNKAIPEDTPLHDKLIKDERFATISALLENQKELTDVDGIAEKKAANIVTHVKSKQG